MLLGAPLPASARGRRRVRARLVVLGLLAAALLPGAPAAAHDTLVGSDPADGAVLDAPPAQVVLTFSAAPASVGAEVLVQGPDGAVWSTGPATVDGVTVSQSLAAGAPAGAYAVTWRAVAADGHPVTGTLGFSVTAPAAPASPTAAPTPGAMPETAAPTAPPTPSPEPARPTATLSAVAPADGDPDDPALQSAWPWLLVGLVVVGAAVVVTVRRRGGAR